MGEEGEGLEGDDAGSKSKDPLTRQGGGGCLPCCAEKLASGVLFDHLFCGGGVAVVDAEN